MRLQNCICEDMGERLAPHGKLVEPEVVGGSDSEVEDVWCMEREDSSEEEGKNWGGKRTALWHDGQRTEERTNEGMEVMKVEDEGALWKGIRIRVWGWGDEDEMEPHLNQPSFERRTK